MLLIYSIYQNYLGKFSQPLEEVKLIKNCSVNLGQKLNGQITKKSIT